MTTTPLRPPCPHCGDAGDAKLRQLRDELTPVIGSERHSPSYQQCASRVVTRIESLLAAPAPSPSAPPADADAFASHTFISDGGRPMSRCAKCNTGYKEAGIVWCRPSAPPAAVDAPGDEVLRDFVLGVDANQITGLIARAVAELARRALAQEPKP